ncbi:exported protein of unknown function [Pseudodesulfovibrio piezophilus C1TLV30]|uniref:Uncharacterized protein n=1 Tax=Pseudodesulfovibrio piezophilus (strain DSM 21447 / JCM 15486 / C1TLV30) TaxID=1322246 RepID=M1WS21_PSEP2|nr:exported protein of unknown function [Pseudodesulfovibrio piezophilus C1TLV30]
MKNVHQIIGAGVVFGLVSLWFGLTSGVVVGLVAYLGLRVATKQIKAD